jgi:rhodanese-related sulfurtransferase
LRRDVRPADEFAPGHVPGAVSIPPAELEARLSEVPSGREVVVAHGIAARRLKEGLPDWRAAGLPVETAAWAAPRVVFTMHLRSIAFRINRLSMLSRVEKSMRHWRGACAPGAPTRFAIGPALAELTARP